MVNNCWGKMIRMWCGKRLFLGAKRLSVRDAARNVPTLVDHKYRTAWTGQLAKTAGKTG